MEKRRANAVLSKKLEILKNYRALRKCSQRATAQQLYISRGCLQNFLSDEAVLQNVASLFGPSKRKRQRYGKDQEVEDGQWKWFKYAQSRNAPVNGPILVQKTEEISKQLGQNEFMALKGGFIAGKKYMT